MSIRSMPDYDRVKHLELISKAIERMDKSSTAMRTLSPAAPAAALLLIDKSVPAWLALGVAAFAILVYWRQDALFLARERAFRKLYDQARRGDLDRDPYVMDIRRLYHTPSLWGCAWVGSIAGVHGAALLFTAVSFVTISLNAWK